MEDICCVWPLPPPPSHHQACAYFAGNVTTERNGGFASVRSQPNWPGWGSTILGPDAHGVCMQVRGDGRQYKLTIKAASELTGQWGEGVNYQCDFQPPAGTWHEVCWEGILYTTHSGMDTHTTPSVLHAHTHTHTYTHTYIHKYLHTYTQKPTGAAIIYIICSDSTRQACARGTCITR